MYMEQTESSLGKGTIALQKEVEGAGKVIDDKQSLRAVVLKL